MCGRYTVRTDRPELEKLFGKLPFPEMTPRYNLGPGQKLLCVREVDGEREVAQLKWGLLPRFVADAKKAAKPINARAEAVATNGYFKQAFARRRCLIAADGFYEPEETEGQKTGRWWYFKFQDDDPFAFPGLWETWGAGDAFVETFTVITTDAMDVVAKCGHPRSPVILPPETFDLWLDPEGKPPQLKRLLVPHPSDDMVGYPVNGRAKNPRNEGPDLIEPVESGQ